MSFASQGGMLYRQFHSLDKYMDYLQCINNLLNEVVIVLFSLSPISLRSLIEFPISESTKNSPKQ